MKSPLVNCTADSRLNYKLSSNMNEPGQKKKLETNLGEYYPNPPVKGYVRESYHLYPCIIVTFSFLIFVAIMSMFYGIYERNIYPQLIPADKLYDEYNFKPEQIHLSLGSNDSEIYVTWSTRNKIYSEVRYYRYDKDNPLRPVRVAVGEHTPWTSSEKDPKLAHATRTKHMTHHTYRARLVGLKPGSRYNYFVVSQNAYMRVESRVYHFKTKSLSNHKNPINIAFYGDLGVINGQSIPRLIQDVDEDKYDFIIHNGDFAYDLDTNHGWLGDDFMRLIEPIAARVPYQTSVGNHEIAEKFLHYDNRFTMINSGGIGSSSKNNFFYSFNAGPIHFVAISTEFYYFLDYIGIEALNLQWEWLKRDLAFANTQEERSKRPWVIIFGHRPMYCSGRDEDDCSKDSNILRRGLPFLGTYALEKLFYDNGVDVEIYAHEHQYERFLPIYNGTVMNGTSDPHNPYVNPRAPVHVISGSAGCQERIDPFSHEPATGSVKQLTDYGFTRLQADGCNLLFQQVSDDKDGLIIDEFMIMKTRHNYPATSNLTYC